MTKGKEIRFINFIKGGLIFLVVLGHVLKGDYFHLFSKSGEVNIRACIYIFHMPLFFFLSGYLFNINRSLKEFYAWLKYLFIIFLVAILIYQILFVRQFSFLAVIEMIVAPFNHLWYLLALMLYGIVVIYITKYLSSNIQVFLLFFTLFLSIVLYSSQEVWSASDYWFLNKSLLRPIQFFFYFLLGIYLKSKSGYEFPSYLKYILLCVSIVFLIPNFEGYMFEGIFRAIGTILLNCFLILIISKSIVTKDYMGLSIINDIGKNSLFIYLWHYAPILLFEKIIPSNNLLFFIFEALLITIGLHFLHQLLNSKFDFKYKRYLGFR